MASIKKVCSEIKGSVQDGIAWVAIWQAGRSWEAEAFWPEGGGFKEGFIFAPEDVSFMRDILAEDHKAVILNGYYTNVGEVDSMTIKSLQDAVEWNYYNRFNNLWSFLDDYIIKDEAA